MSCLYWLCVFICCLLAVLHNIFGQFKKVRNVIANGICTSKRFYLCIYGKILSISDLGEIYLSGKEHA